MTKQITPDLIEAGSGPKVILVHSSVAGARQWGSLMSALSDVMAEEPRGRLERVAFNPIRRVSDFALSPTEIDSEI